MNSLIIVHPLYLSSPISASPLTPDTGTGTYTYIPVTAHYSENTLLFQKCIQRQVDKVPFHTQSDQSYRIIVDMETQEKRVLSLKDYIGKSFPVSLSPHLNICNVIILIATGTCQLTTSIALTVLTNIAKIVFNEQDLLQEAYVGRTHCKDQPYIPPLHQCQKWWHFGHFTKYCRSTAHCPLCAEPDNDYSTCPSKTLICAINNG